MSKEMEKITEETKVPDMAEAQAMSDDELDEVAGGVFKQTGKTKISNLLYKQTTSKTKTSDLVYRQGTTTGTTSKKKTGGVTISKL
ncbi:MAG: hypothetical protein LUD16_05180 [Lachnospiraceae bacterium]|nr:hypothetical protein [Lachnospiraceae bacterium]